jgi:hypothetical protein
MWYETPDGKFHEGTAARQFTDDYIHSIVKGGIMPSWCISLSIKSGTSAELTDLERKSHY